MVAKGRKLSTKGPLVAAVLAALGVAIWAFANQGAASRAPERSTRLAFEPTVEQRKSMEELRSRVSKENPRFPQEDAREKANAKLFTYMAETSKEDHVVLASLDAIQSAYSSRSARKEAPDADLDQVLSKHMRSERPVIALAALAAARIPLMVEQPSNALTSAIAALAAPEQPPARRQAALEALNLIRPDRRGPHVLAAFDQALSAKEPHLVSLALLALSQSGPSLGAEAGPRAALVTRVLELSRHADPGVAGRALAVLAENPRLADADARLLAAKEGLGHAHPYVRAQAADLALKSGDSRLIHALIPHVADLRPGRYDLTGWSQLDGKPGTLQHAVPGRKRVGDAALFALLTLSQGLQGAKPLVLTLGGPQQGDDTVLQNAETARAWYREVAERVPPG